jgi:hypothetical protein
MAKLPTELTENGEMLHLTAANHTSNPSIRAKKESRHLGWRDISRLVLGCVIRKVLAMVLSD